MNLELDPLKTKEDREYYSVQSEYEIWWPATFEVPKEDHEILKKNFSLSNIPNVIVQHRNGQKLNVKGYYN